MTAYKYETAPKRLGVICSVQNIVDDYICYILNNLCSNFNLDRLIIVFNGTPTINEKRKLLRYTSEIIATPFSKKSPISWASIISNNIGISETCKYDEIVIINDSFVGPFVSFSEIFNTMSTSDADFWTLLSFVDDLEESINGIPFFVMKNSILKSPSFQYLLNCKQNSITKKDIFDIGFTVDSYSNHIGMSPITYTTYIYDPLKLLVNGSPVISMDSFIKSTAEILNYCHGENLSSAISWLKANTKYDTNLILGHLIRVLSPQALQDNLHLEYIIPEYNAIDCSTKLKAGVFLHIYYSENIERYINFIEGIPSYIDIYISTVSEEKKEHICRTLADMQSRITVVVKPNRGRDISSLLVAFKDYIKRYDVICFCHDKASPHLDSLSSESWERLLWNNTLKSCEYISNILSLFETNPLLGLLASPQPISGSLLGCMNDNLYWKGNYENTLKLMERLQVMASFSKKELCLAIGTAFWCRTNALSPLFDFPWEYEDFPEEPLEVDGQISHAIERCMPYVVKYKGFYTGTMMTAEYAAAFYSSYRSELLEKTTNTFSILVTARKYGLKSAVMNLRNGFINLNKRFAVLITAMLSKFRTNLKFK